MGNIKKRFRGGCRASKMVIEMRLQDSVAQMGSLLEIFHYMLGFLRNGKQYHKTIRTGLKGFESAIQNVFT